MSSLDRWLSERFRTLVFAWLSTCGAVALLGLPSLWLSPSIHAVDVAPLLLGVSVVGGLTMLALGGLVVARLEHFRGIATGRLAALEIHRLRALGELRRLPGFAARFSLAGWLACGVAIGLWAKVLGDASWGLVGRLIFVTSLEAVLGAALVGVVLTVHVHPLCDRLAEGLRPADVLGVAPGATWSARRLAVALTVLFSVVPVILLSDLASLGLDVAGAAIRAAPEAERAAVAQHQSWVLLGWLGALAAVCVLLAARLALAAGEVVASPMQRLASEARHVTEGRLAALHVISAEGEVGRVTGVFAQLHERLATLVRQVLEAGGQLSAASLTLKQTSARSEATATEQAAALNETSATTEELARSARQIAGNAASVQELTRRTLEAAEAGQRAAVDFRSAVERMSQDNRSIAGAVDRLQRRVLQIGRIVDLINTVADRSDLLALSAELEGTRAGEVGRGFALVGAEMRRLAENVLESTAEVEELIAEIRDATQRTAQATEEGSALTRRSTGLADEVTSALAQVTALALETTNEVRGITLASQQQQSGTDQLAEAMADILGGTQTELATTHRLGEVNAKLVTLSSSLQAIVERFKSHQEHA